MPGRSISTTLFCAFGFSTRHSLNISVHCDFQSRVTQTLLNEFRINSVHGSNIHSVSRSRCILLLLQSLMNHLTAEMMSCIPYVVMLHMEMHYA